MRLIPIVPALLLCLVLLAACGGSEPEANDPNQYASQTGTYPQGQYGQGQYQPGQYQQPTTQPTQTTQTGGLPSIPGIPGLGQSTASSGGSATPIAFAAVLSPAIQMLASSEAPGMAADGQAFAGQFQEGQTLEQPFNIQSGKCYTIVAASAGAVQQLDVQLVAEQAPLPPVVLAQGSGSSTATVGGRSSGCFRNPLPIGGPGKVILKATRGSGIAGAQLFVK
jgi:hypothetical protein